MFTTRRSTDLSTTLRALLLLMLTTTSLQVQAAPVNSLDSIENLNGQGARVEYLRSDYLCKAKVYKTAFAQAGHENLGEEVAKCIQRAAYARPASPEGILYNDAPVACFEEVKGRGEGGDGQWVEGDVKAVYEQLSCEQCLRPL